MLVNGESGAGRRERPRRHIAEKRFQASEINVRAARVFGWSSRNV